MILFLIKTLMILPIYKVYFLQIIFKTVLRMYNSHKQERMNEK